ncbi:hypothetical protein ACQFX9_01980 [Aliinostoc sp. HNIBRCY26]
MTNRHFGIHIFQSIGMLWKWDKFRVKSNKNVSSLSRELRDFYLLS